MKFLLTSSYAYPFFSSLLIPLFCLYCSGPHRDLHSFPTRRSSDLLPPDQEQALERLRSACGPGREFERRGPGGAGAVTWLGARALALLGDRSALDAVLTQRFTPRGLLRLSLPAGPEVALPDLLTQWSAANAQLRRSGLFAQLDAQGRLQPGPRWRPGLLGAAAAATAPARRAAGPTSAADIERAALAGQPLRGLSLPALDAVGARWHRLRAQDCA